VAGMTRMSVVLSGCVVLMIVGVPILYQIQKSRTFRNFRVVEEGQIYRSGQMSEAGFERVCREYGIRTVIKLREASEKPSDIAVDEAEEAYCRAHGIEFIRVLPKDWEEDEKGKVPMEENLRWFERALDDPSKTPRPILIHCFAGIHRTGSMVAVYRMKQHGWTNAEAVAELKECGRATTTYVGNLLPYLSNEFKLSEADGKQVP